MRIVIHKRAFEHLPGWINPDSPWSIRHDDLSMLSRSDGWCFGAGGTILRYNGLTWKSQVSGTTKDLRGCHMLSPQEGWCVGQDNTILHYQDGVWQKIELQRS
jgi:photosystem II stability/assembly factor-like uncharacterized protein